MKFAENFNLHKTTNRNVELFYLDTIMPESVLSKTENDYLFSNISITPTKLSVKLDDKVITTKVTQDQILELESVGLKPIEMIKTQLSNEFNRFYETDLFEKTFNNSITLDSNLTFTGFKGWFYNLIGYCPKLYASHPNFLSKIIFASNRILQETRISSAKWILVPPKLAVIFDDQSNFEYAKISNSSSISSTMINHLGTWHVANGLNVYVSHLIKDNWILIGRSPNSLHDKLVTTVISEDQFSHQKTVDTTMIEINLFELRKLYNTFLIPGSETSYAKWEFVYKQETFTDWFILHVKNIFSNLLKSLKNVLHLYK